MQRNTIEIDDEEEGEDFLLELAAIEAALAKRPKLTPTIPDGPYMAALKGSYIEEEQKQSNNNGSEPIDKDCPCGVGICSVRTSNTEKNPGRKFYSCPFREDNGGCGFFQWCDAATVNSSGTYSYDKDSSKFPEIQCPCGAGLCRTLTTKSGENVGKQYYRCPVFEGSCGFFKWCNSDDVVNSTSYAKVSNVSDSESGRGYQAVKTSTPCYKCGKEGHWARECTGMGGGPVKTTTAAAGGGSCYKCGKQDHWAKDCTAQTGNVMSNVKSSSSSGACYKCGKEGHWARDCTGQSSNQQYGSGQGKSSATSSATSSSSGGCYKCGDSGHWARDCTSSTTTTGKRQRQQY